MVAYHVMAGSPSLLKAERLVLYNEMDRLRRRLNVYPGAHSL